MDVCVWVYVCGCMCVGVCVWVYVCGCMCVGVCVWVCMTHMCILVPQRLLLKEVNKLLSYHGEVMELSELNDMLKECENMLNHIRTLATEVSLCS